MEFLQGRSVETMAAIAVAVVAVAVGGAFLLRRSKKPKGIVLRILLTGRCMHA
jgi:cytochrome-b5 reductase